jgi:dimethylaniline monooxygenase (N-oxide forming)
MSNHFNNISVNFSPLAWFSTQPAPNIPKLSSIDYRLWIESFSLLLFINTIRFGRNNNLATTTTTLQKIVTKSTQQILIPFLFTLTIKSLYKIYAKKITQRHAAPQTQLDYIMKTPKRSEKIAVIGMGISGIQCLKSCLAEGIEPTGFELDSDIGGFWRFKSDQSKPSVYESTHIDTDRDLAGYSDFPWNPHAPLTIHNSIMTQYMRENIQLLRLDRFIRFNTKVISITPHEKLTENNKWNWKIISINTLTNEQREEIFEGVMICTGRHGGGAWIPDFPGLSNHQFKKPWFHSSQYKNPQSHGIDSSKTVVVVGIGNSGLDIVTEVSPVAKKTILVSRSGAWITKLPYGDRAFSNAVGDRLTMGTFLSLPWFLQTELFELKGLMFESDMVKDQAVLNKHGLKPKHRMWQQHPLMTGLNGHPTIHSELENGHIIVKKGIDHFTENGIQFVDESIPMEDVDLVIFATGYKQQCSAVDPKVVDLSFGRAGNDLLLWKGIFPVNEYGTSLGFVNQLQTITFFASDLQSRTFLQVFLDRLKLPSPEERLQEVLDTRKTLCAQYIDRLQLRVQSGANYLYYEDLAEFLGCRPTLSRILSQRPTAVWHAFFVTWCPLQYRLVGPGRFEIAEQWIEEHYATRFYSPYPINTPFLPGQAKIEPNDRYGLVGLFNQILGYTSVFGLAFFARYVKGWQVGGTIRDHLQQNIVYAKEDVEKRGIPHQLEFGGEPSIDQSSSKGHNNKVVIERVSVWGKNNFR